MDVVVCSYYSRLIALCSIEAMHLRMDRVGGFARALKLRYGNRVPQFWLSPHALQSEVLFKMGCGPWGHPGITKGKKRSKYGVSVKCLPLLAELVSLSGMNEEQKYSSSIFNFFLCMIFFYMESKVYYFGRHPIILSWRVMVLKLLKGKLR